MSANDQLLRYYVVCVLVFLALLVGVVTLMRHHTRILIREFEKQFPGRCGTCVFYRWAEERIPRHKCVEK